jgi:hypothetical protein
MKEAIIKQNISKIYLSLLNRIPTDYEFYIYYHAIKFGLPVSQLKNIIKNSSEYNYFVNIKKNIINNNYDNFNIKDKKIAICFSGHARNLNKTYINFIKNLIKPLNADIFIHTWDTLGAQKNRGDSVGIGYSDIPINKEILNIINKLNPKTYIIENFSNKINNFNIPSEVYMYGAPVNNNGVVNSTARPENIISQLYSIYKSFSLLEDYEKENKIKYDIVIKTRFDFNIESRISKNNIQNLLNNENILYTLDKNKSSSSFENCKKCKIDYHNGEHDSIISDLFIFGKYNQMKKYMNLYNEYYNLYNSLISNVDIENINFSYKKENLKFIGNIDQAIYSAPCFFPERLLMTYLSDIRILDSDVFGYIVR